MIDAQRSDVIRAPTDWFWDGFFGYGNLRAPVWIVGMEDACDDDDDAARRLPVLQRFPVTYDLRQAHEDFQYRPFPTNVPVWDAARAIYGACGLDDTLGTMDGDTLLSEVLPLPRPSNRSWPAVYRELFKDYPAYERAVLVRRATRLVSMVQAHQPAVVVVHGRRYHSQVEGASLERGAFVVRQAVYLDNKIASVLRLGATFLAFVHNLGGSTAWSNAARAQLASVVASMRIGELPDEAQPSTAPPPVEALLSGMFFHRMGNVLPKDVVAFLPGLSVGAGRREVAGLIGRPDFRAWATTNFEALGGRTPVVACMARDRSDLQNQLKRTPRLHKRYGGWSGEQLRAAVDAAHRLVAAWAELDE